MQSSTTIKEINPMRYHYLDALRSVLMLLGVVYHAALIYTGHPWRVTDPQHARVFALLAHYSHAFRMPAFFIIAGFFAAFSLLRHGAWSFCKSRAQRLVPPLVVTFLVLNTLMIFFQERLVSHRTQSMISFLTSRIWVIHRTGYGIGHLWFLSNLIFYSLLLVVAVLLIGRTRIERWRRTTADAPPARLELTLILLLLPLIDVGLFIMRKLQPHLYRGNFLYNHDVTYLLEYFTFFCFGVWLYTDQRLARAFHRIRLWHVAVLLGAWLAPDFIRPGRPLGKRVLLLTYADGLQVWLACLFCFALFKRLFDRSSRLFAYLSDASYTIYLWHMLCIIIVGGLLTRIHLYPQLKFTLVVAITFAITLGIHHFLVLRVGVLRFMFNGKWLKPAAAPGNSK